MTDQTFWNEEYEPNASTVPNIEIEVLNEAEKTEFMEAFGKMPHPFATKL